MLLDFDSNIFSRDLFFEFVRLVCCLHCPDHHLAPYPFAGCLPGLCSRCSDPGSGPGSIGEVEEKESPTKRINQENKPMS